MVERRRRASTPAARGHAGRLIFPFTFMTFPNGREVDRELVSNSTTTPQCIKCSWPTDPRKLSPVRLWLGDAPVLIVVVEYEADYEPMRALFPEAVVVLHDPTAPGISTAPI